MIFYRRPEHTTEREVAEAAVKIVSGIGFTPPACLPGVLWASAQWPLSNIRLVAVCALFFKSAQRVCNTANY